MMELLEAVENLRKAKIEMSKHYGSVDIERDADYSLFKCGDCGRHLLTQYGYWDKMVLDTPLICCDKIRLG